MPQSHSGKLFLFRRALIGGLGLLGACSVGQARASSLEVLHADSLAGPMKEIKKAFDGRHQGVTIRLTSGVSKQLAERILKGDACDVFASSSPAKGIRQGSTMSLIWPGAGVTFIRVTGDKDLATDRTIRFLKNATALAGKAKLAQRIIDGAAVDPSKPTSVPDAIRAVKEGKATAALPITRRLSRPGMTWISSAFPPVLI